MTVTKPDNGTCLNMTDTKIIGAIFLGRHNSDIRRLKGVTEKDVARMVRYHEFYLELVAHQMR